MTQLFDFTINKLKKCISIPDKILISSLAIINFVPELKIQAQNGIDSMHVWDEDTVEVIVKTDTILSEDLLCN